MKPRLYPYLDLLLLFGVLAGGIYFYRNPAAARRWLDAVTVQTNSGAQAGPSWMDRLNAPPAATASWGTRIAAGHAFAKHGLKMGFRSSSEMAAFIDRVIASPSARRSLSHGRQAYWDDRSGTVVICDPNTADGGTAFRPDRGRSYFENLR